ncbi:MAG: hypothetical protein WCJ39_03780 [bacterium]
MASNVALIHQFLPQELRSQAELFTIPEQFLQTMPDLVGMILQSKSMDTSEEKQSWFTLFPMMNEEQIGKLRDILTREKQKLQEIDQKYAQKKDTAYTKTVSLLDTVAQQEKVHQLQAQEANIQQKDSAEADDLLAHI